MNTDTNQAPHWSPLRALSLTGLWLALVAAIALVLSHGCTPTASQPAATGSISLAWSLVDSTGQLATCAQAGARSVALRLRNRAGGDLVATAFPCTRNPGTAPVPAGVYDIAIELHASDGSRLARAPDQLGVAIAAGRTRTLAPVLFTPRAERTLTLALTTTAGSNCGAPRGARITGSSLVLIRRGVGCERATFTRSRRGTPIGTYTVDCAAPSVVDCIENTETLTANVPPGTYTVQARGRVQSLECWQRDETIEVRPGDTPIVRTLTLTRENKPGC